MPILLWVKFVLLLLGCFPACAIEAYISADLWYNALEITKDAEKLAKMKALITDYGITVIPASTEIERLAEVYVSAGIYSYPSRGDRP